MDTNGESPNMNGNVTGTVQTDFHQFLVNEAGVLLYKATDEVEPEDLTRADAIELQFSEVLAFADYVQAHREEFVAAQRKLEQTWVAVADEVIDRLESRELGSATEANGTVIQDILYELGPVGFHGIRMPAKSVAGKWYQSLWTSDSYATTFGQQWVPFQIAFQARLRERFPDRYPPEDGDEIGGDTPS